MKELKIKRALVSVWDKKGISEFCRTLQKLKVEIFSSGGTYRHLKAAGIPVKDIAKITGFSQLLDGRVKTLHPLIHAPILARKDNPQHLAELKKLKIKPFDLVVVNLYPFGQKTKESLSFEKMQEYIDIGGPTLLRAAAKNFQSVAVVSSPHQYKRVSGILEKQQGSLSLSLRRDLAKDVFRLTSEYDAAIFDYLAGKKPLWVYLEKKSSLRYGENPHQKAALYANGKEVKFKQLWGKELSFNNFMDLDAAFSIVRHFRHPAACVIKHNNPCGVALGKNLASAYVRAFKADPISSFGGIIGLNQKVDEKTAQAIIKSGFREVVLAPGFSKKALAILQVKKNLRLVEVNLRKYNNSLQIRKTAFGYLVQEEDRKVIEADKIKVVSRLAPTPRQKEDLLFAWFVAKYTKSNAIVIAKNFQTLGIGCGQPSRVGAVKIAIEKSLQPTQGAVLASDGFFPKEDNLELAKACGIKAVIQPGGSIKDKDLIALADKLKIAMVFTSMRHFRH